jgi:hypothetical protein
MNRTAVNNPGMPPPPAPGITGPVLLVVAGGAVSQAAIARTAELAAGAPVTVVGIGSTEISRTDACSSRPSRPDHPAGEARQRVSPSHPGQAGSTSGPSPRPGALGNPGPPSLRARQAEGSGGPPSRAGAESEQVRRTVALAMSVLENTGVTATGHVAVTGSPARAVARMARACGARVVILDQPGHSVAGQQGHVGGSGSAAGRGSAVRDGAGSAGLMAELRRRMYGSGIVVLAETARRGGWVSA